MMANNRVPVWCQQVMALLNTVTLVEIIIFLLISRIEAKFVIETEP